MRVPPALQRLRPRQPFRVGEHAFRVENDEGNDERWFVEMAPANVDVRGVEPGTFQRVLGPFRYWEEARAAIAGYVFAKVRAGDVEDEFDDD